MSWLETIAYHGAWIGPLLTVIGFAAKYSAVIPVELCFLLGAFIFLAASVADLACLILLGLKPENHQPNDNP